MRTRHTSAFRSALFTGSALGSLLFTSAALAQTAPNAGDDATNFDEIIVTAQRVEQNLQDVPVSIVALPGDALDNRGIDSFEQIQFVAPGVGFQAGVNARQSATYIRGIGTSLFNSGIEGSVAIVVDGVVLGREGAGLLDFYDMERVEVLRGPQGTLFGKNASAGVLSFITRNPTDELTGSVRLAYGSDNEVNLGAVISGPMAEGVRGRLTGFYNTRDGYIDNVFPGAPQDELNDREDFGLRGKIEFDEGPGLFRLTADYSKRDDNGGALTTRSFSTQNGGGPGTGLLGSGVPLIPLTLSGFGIVPGADNFQIASDQSFFAEAEVYGISLEYTRPFGDLDFTSLSAWRGWESRDNNDADLVPIPILSENSGDLSQRQFSQEFRLAGGSDRLQYVAGAFGFYQDIEDNQVQVGTFGTTSLAQALAPVVMLPPEVVLTNVILGLPFGVPPLPLGSEAGSITTIESDEVNLALFGQADYAVTDQLSVIAGARLVYSEVEGTNDIQIAPGAFAPSFLSTAATPVPLEASAEDTALVWRLGAQYDFNSDVNVFGTVTRGFKSSGLVNGVGVQESAPGSGRFPTVDPEIPLQFEAGIRSTLADGTVRANLTAFHTTIDDYQAQTLVPNDTGINLFLVANAGEVRTQGVEADLSWAPNRNFSASVAAAYTDATFQDFPQAPCFTLQPVGPGQCIDGNGDGVGDFQNLKGVELGNSPDFILNATARYEFDDLGGYRPFGQIGIQTRSDDTSGNGNETATTIDGYTLVDAQIGTFFDDDRASITLFVRNLFDENFATSIFGAPFDDGGFAQFISYEAQRSWGARLTYDFE